jgi:hypothetical protein
MLIKRCMRVITASGDDLTDATDPSRIVTDQEYFEMAKFIQVTRWDQTYERADKILVNTEQIVQIAGLVYLYAVPLSAVGAAESIRQDVWQSDCATKLKRYSAQRYANASDQRHG